VLASKSAARRNILANLKIDAEVYITNADETLGENFPPWEIVKILSQRKAHFAAAQIGGPGVMIIAADTVVEYGGNIIGKPASEEEAAKTLFMLSGELHRVYSGITVIFDDTAVCGYDVTTVKFRELSCEEIEQYVKTGDPLTKAGSYGAEGPGSAFIERIEGDFFNIAGLPVFKFANILKNSFSMTIFDLVSRDMI
jgi:septum formation protein